MSADDFQTKYSSVMEGMLRSAVAETTKLFETMVDELKAEISKIKKENEDLKRKCSQFEKATTNGCNETESNPRKSDSCEKRDTAIQCDLVPFRAMLVEQCEPLQPSTEYVWQEHNYENREGRTSQMALVFVKQNDSPEQTVVKQEEVEPPLPCVKDTKVVTSAYENEGQSTNQECSTTEVLLPQRNEEAQAGLDLQKSKGASSSIGAHNQSSDLQHSLSAVKGNKEKETEVGLQISEIRTRGRLVIATGLPLDVAQSRSEAELPGNEQPSDSTLTVSEQTDADCSNQLADKFTPPDKPKAHDELTNSKMSETEPEQPVRRKRGRPPKKAKQPPVKQTLKSKCTSENKTSESQQPSLGVKDGASQVPTLDDSSTVAQPNTPTTDSPQESLPQSRERRTSATLQDAMLLVEAMNQSTDKSAPSSPQRIAATTQTLQTVHEVPAEPEKTSISMETKEAASNEQLQATTAAEAPTQKKTDTPEQQPAVTLSCTDSSSVATLAASTHTSVGSVQQHQPQMVAQSKPGEAVTRKIIVMSRSSASLMSGKFAGKLATQQPAVVSAVIAAQNNSEPPKLTPEGITSVNPSLSTIPLKNIIITTNKPPPTPSTDSQSGSLSQPKVAILIPRQPSAVELRKQSQVIDLSTKQESGKSSDPNVATSPSSQEVNKATTVPAAELINTFDNLESHKLIMNQPPRTAEQTPPAVVRLTRLPFPMSTQETVSIIKLHSSKKSETQSSQPSEKQVSSSNVCVNTKEASVVGFDDSTGNGDVAAEPSTSKLEKGTSTAAQDSSSPNVPPIEQPSPAVIHLKSIKSRDKSDPHSQMTKTQFLAQLAVSPILTDQAEPPTGDSVAAAASCPTTSTSDETSLQENTLVAKLRRHLKPHLQGRSSKTNQELCTETEILTADPKEPEIETDDPDAYSQTVEPIPHNPEKHLEGSNTTSPDETTNDISSVNTRKSRLCKDGLKSTSPAGEPAPVSPHRLKATGESTPVSLRSATTDRDCDSSHNIKSTFVSPRRSNSSREGTISVKRQIISHSPRNLSSAKERAILEKIKTTTVHLRKTSATGDSAGSKSNTVSSHPTNFETPKRTKSTGSLLKTTNNESTFYCRRKCTLPRLGTVTKPSKSESDVFSLRSCDMSADGTPVELAEEDVRSRKTRESTPAQKRKLIPEGSSPNENLAVATCKRQAKATMVKIDARIESKSPPGSEGLRKFTAKGVWTPPILTLIDSPLAATKKSPNSTPIKTETKPPTPPLVYPPSVSLHPIPVWAPPVVSPLQPLSVIGWRLLKNQCGECGRVLSSSAALESHVSLHTGHRPFSCKLCGKRFPDSKGLKRHGRVHRNGRIHICKQCGKGFVYSFGLTKHLQMVHSRIKPFVCQVCNKGFFSKRDVEAHIRIHTGERPFHCNLCEKKFARRTELNVHLRWHNGEKRHWCPFCGKGFLDINNLKRHKYTHTGERPHSCPHCPKHFTQSGHLKKHVKNVHKIQ